MLRGFDSRRLHCTVRRLARLFPREANGSDDHLAKGDAGGRVDHCQSSGERHGVEPEVGERGEQCYPNKSGDGNDPPPTDEQPEQQDSRDHLSQYRRESGSAGASADVQHGATRSFGAAEPIASTLPGNVGGRCTTAREPGSRSSETLRAPAPRRLPIWLARLTAGYLAVQQMTVQRGASNRRIRNELAWTPEYGDWREGFAAFRASPAGAIARVKDA